jgi:lipopolysaccharide export system protein LptC
MKGFKLSQLTVLAILAIVGAFLTYFAVLSGDNAGNLLGRVTGDRMDLYVVQAQGTKFDETGRRMQTFEAQRLTHFLDSDHSNLVEPRFQIYTKKDAIWDGSATSGKLIGEDEIKLRDNVVIVERDGITKLTTTELNYFPNQQKVDSAVAVKITRGEDTTNAVGMRADLNTNRVELLTRVESRHVAP